jgi:hypothetical protein
MRKTSHCIPDEVVDSQATIRIDATNSYPYRMRDFYRQDPILQVAQN